MQSLLGQHWIYMFDGRIQDHEGLWRMKPHYIVMLKSKHNLITFREHVGPVYS